MKHDERAQIVWDCFKHGLAIPKKIAKHYEVREQEGVKYLVFLQSVFQDTEITLKVSSYASWSREGFIKTCVSKRYTSESVEEFTQRVQLQAKGEEFTFTPTIWKGCHVVAIKTACITIGNGELLRGIRGQGEMQNYRQTDIQRLMEQDQVMLLPLNILCQGLDSESPFPDFTSIKILDQSPAKVYPEMTVPKMGGGRRKEKNFHFMGARLFSIGKKTWLMDLDHQEADDPTKPILNQFVVPIPQGTKTIQEAYTELQPPVIRELLKKGVEVKRQGEFFFYPEDLPEFPKFDTYQQKVLSIVEFPDHIRRYLMAVRDDSVGSLSMWSHNKTQVEELLTKVFGKIPSVDEAQELLSLVAPAVRASSALTNRYLLDSHLFEESYTDPAHNRLWARGEVSHRNDEHNDLILDRWYRVIPNTVAGKAFKITGQVD